MFPKRLGSDNLQNVIFFFQAEDGIRDLVRSRGLGDVYKRQLADRNPHMRISAFRHGMNFYSPEAVQVFRAHYYGCLLYKSDAADDLLCVDFGGSSIIKKKIFFNKL